MRLVLEIDCDESFHNLDNGLLDLAQCLQASADWLRNRTQRGIDSITLLSVDGKVINEP